MEDLGAQVNNIWDSNKAEFERSLDDWLRRLKEGEKLIRQARSQFHQWDPLRVYVSVTKAKSNLFSLRFFGQEVAELLVKGRDVALKLNGQHKKNNKKWFEFALDDGAYDWRGDEAKGFREHFSRLAFSKQGQPRIGIPEHRIESKFITEMFGPSGKFGVPHLRIQPVTIGGCPLQFPVPISASTGQPKPCKGNIDILSRHLGTNNKTRLSVWELKKPNIYAHAASQACIYAFTLLRILRDTKKGPEWYRLFGYKSLMPKRLEIEAVVAITSDKRNYFIREKAELQRSTSFEIGNDSIKLYAAYYKEGDRYIKLEQDPFRASI